MPVRPLRTPRVPLPWQVGEPGPLLPEASRQEVSGGGPQCWWAVGSPTSKSSSQGWCPTTPAPVTSPVTTSGRILPSTSSRSRVRASRTWAPSSISSCRPGMPRKMVRYRSYKHTQTHIPGKITALGYQCPTDILFSPFGMDSMVVWMRPQTTSCAGSPTASWEPSATGKSSVDTSLVGSLCPPCRVKYHAFLPARRTSHPDTSWWWKRRPVLIRMCGACRG